MIDISTLTEADKGREVRYECFVGVFDYGTITSWNDRFIFVRYHSRVEEDRTPPIYGDTSQSTTPAGLEFTA